MISTGCDALNSYHVEDKQTGQRTWDARQPHQKNFLESDDLKWIWKEGHQSVSVNEYNQKMSTPDFFLETY